jgi:hypothetical protein
MEESEEAFHAMERGETLRSVIRLLPLGNDSSVAGAFDRGKGAPSCNRFGE